MEPFQSINQIIKLHIMNSKMFFLGLSAVVFLYSCQGNSTPAETTQSKVTSVETQKANTDYQPAFEGQTRIGAVQTMAQLKVEVLTENLGRPWAIINLPDGRFLVTEKSGFLNIVSTDGQTITKIEGLPKVDDVAQGGLLDVALDPDFDQNKIIYWTYSEPFGKGNLTTLAKGVLSEENKKVENAKVIFRAEPSYDGKLHYGSRLAFDKDGLLYVSTGERSDKETRALAQKTDNYLGKILRLTKEGKPAPGNPFIGKSGYKPEIYSYGHRNPQGLAMDEKGQLWDSEFGPRGGDEINLIQAGKNYGWGDVTYGLEYSGDKIGTAITQKEGTEQPVYYWDPSISPSGITFYKGNIDEWNGNLFIGALSGQHIARIILKDNKVVGEERLLEKENQRFRDVLSGADGNLYAVTDSGKLYKISKK